MRVLLVDDDEDALAPLCDQVDDSGQVDIDWKRVGFEGVESEIADFDPDLIVLDIFSGHPSDRAYTGSDRLERIWQQHFRPVVIYSADPSVVADEYLRHPFITPIEKGVDSELRVERAIGKLRPLVDLLREAKGRIEQEFAKALRDVSPLASSDDQLLGVVERAARRRVAALVDEIDPHAEPIQPWEQYVFPPVSESVRQGDILRQNGEVRLADRYRVVLTPSCDLVASAERSPKVKNVLVARCIDMEHALATMGIAGSPSKKKSRLRRVLNSGVEEHVVPLPQLSSLIPPMAADLRHLELLPFELLENSYEVVASVDSPFREAIAWAYMQTGARPGLPERDTKSWAAEIVDSLSRSGVE